MERFLTDICTLPSETGMCKAHLPKFYYNYGKKRCEEFVYGGCGGNPNRFSTIGDCLATCSGDVKSYNLIGISHLICNKVQNDTSVFVRWFRSDILQTPRGHFEVCNQQSSHAT